MNKAPLITPYIRAEIKDDILYFTYLPGVVITSDIAKEIVKERLEYVEGIKYPVLVMGEGLRSMDKQARDYFSNEGIRDILAGALLVNSVYTEFFGNFFLRITKPAIPAKIFTDEKKALEWLQQFKPQAVAAVS